MIKFRDARVQALAEALLLRFQMVSSAMPVTPRDAEARLALEKILLEKEADLKRVRQLLTLVDMAVALNGGNYDRILKFSDNPEDNPSGETE